MSSFWNKDVPLYKIHYVFHIFLNSRKIFYHNDLFFGNEFWLELKNVDLREV